MLAPAGMARADARGLRGSGPWFRPGRLRDAAASRNSVAAFFMGFNVAGLRSLKRDIPKLVKEMNGILDSTATLTSAFVP
jgi:hypothetical protein